MTIYRNINAVGACVQSYCIFVFNTSTRLLFPTELVDFKCTVSINAWKHGVRLNSSSLTCPSQPICENDIVRYHRNTSLFDLISNNARCQKTHETSSSFISTHSASYICHTTAEVEPMMVPFPPTSRVDEKSHLHTSQLLIPNISQFSCVDNSFRRSIGSTLLPRCRFYRKFERIMFSQQAYYCMRTQPTINLHSTTPWTGIVSSRDHNDKPIRLVLLHFQSIRHVYQRKIEIFTTDHEFNAKSTHRCHRPGS